MHSTLHFFCRRLSWVEGDDGLCLCVTGRAFLRYSRMSRCLGDRLLCLLTFFLLFISRVGLDVYSSSRILPVVLFYIYLCGVRPQQAARVGEHTDRLDQKVPQRNKDTPRAATYALLLLYNNIADL